MRDSLSILILSLCGVCPAATVYVPGTAPTIQAAVNIAATGDTVVVAPGIYYENVLFPGPDIRLQSSDPEDAAIVSSTIIDGQSSGTVLMLAGSEQASTVISGLTIRNGFSATGPGGIHANYTSATIERCRIIDNVGRAGGGLSHAYGKVRNNLIRGNSARDGAGLGWCRNGEITDNEITSNSASNTAPFEYLSRGGGLAYCEGKIARNLISNNSSTGDGGGLYSCSGLIQQNEVTSNTAREDGGGLYSCQGAIDKNTISWNTAGSGGFGSGGGIYNSFGITNNILYGNTAINAGGGIASSGQVYNNTIYANSAYRAGGVYSTGSFRNNIVWDNTAVVDPQISSLPLPEYCCIQDWAGGGTGNITADPQFVGESVFDLHIGLNSPCVDAGGQVSLYSDFDGNCRPPRQSQMPGGDGSGFDIGAFEYPGLCSAQNWQLYF